MNIADVLVHVHSELSAADRTKVKQGVSTCVGVVSANFDQHKHPHALIVQYHPETVKSKQILEVVRQYDPAATLVGL